jgi:hypothetical protein
VAAKERIEELKQLNEDRGPQLSEVQASLIQAAISGIETQVSKNEQAATRWLEECEKSLDGGQQLEGLAKRLQAPPPFLPEDQRPRLEALANTVRSQTEQRQQEATVIGTLKSVSAKGSVEELGKQLALVESASVVTDPAKELVQQKLSAIQSELHRLEVYRLDIPTRLSAVLNLRSLDEIQSDILRHVNLYEGSAFAPEIENALERCKQLRSFFQSLDRLRNGSIVTPLDAQELVSGLRRVAHDYGPQLTNAQESLISEAVADIEEQVGRQMASAARWIAECEVDLASGERLDALLKRLQATPAFLSDNEKPRLAQLLKETTLRIDDDQVLRVLVSFEQISNPIKRVECLDRIKALLEQDSTT